MLILFILQIDHKIVICSYIRKNFIHLLANPRYKTEYDMSPGKKLLSDIKSLSKEALSTKYQFTFHLYIVSSTKLQFVFIYIRNFIYLLANSRYEEKYTYITR